MKAALRRGYLPPPSRALLDWTPGLRRAALLRAEHGDFTLMGDLVEQILGDDRAKGCLEVRTRGLLGLPVEFEEGAGRKKKRAVRALEVDEDFWAMCPEATLAHLLSLAVTAGFAIGELTWRGAKPGARELCDLRVWKTRDCRFDWPSQTWLVRTADGAEVEVVPGDGKWILLAPYGIDRPWAHGLWRALSLAWLAKQGSVHDWSHYNELYGNPLVKGTTPEGTVEDDVDAFGDDLANVNGRTTIALTPGFDVDFVELKSQGYKSFADQIAWADRAIAILILGQNLTTEVEGGSLAAAEVHNQIRHDILRADAEALATCLHAQLLSWWAELNFGDALLAPWPSWDTLPPADAQKVADTLNKGIDAFSKLYAALGDALDAEALLQRFDVPLKPGVDLAAVLAAKKAEADAALQAAQEAANDDAGGGSPKPAKKPPQKGAEAA